MELGDEHNTYVVGVDRTDVRKTVIRTKMDQATTAATEVAVAGTLDRYFRWGTMLVLLLSTPETEVVILDEDNRTLRPGVVLNRRFRLGLAWDVTSFAGA